MGSTVHNATCHDFIAGPSKSPATLNNSLTCSRPLLSLKIHSKTLSNSIPQERESETLCSVYPPHLANQLRIRTTRFVIPNLSLGPSLSFVPQFVENFALFFDHFISLFLSLFSQGSPFFLLRFQTLKLCDQRVSKDQLPASMDASQRHCEFANLHFRFFLFYKTLISCLVSHLCCESKSVLGVSCFSFGQLCRSLWSWNYWGLVSILRVLEVDARF